MSVRPISNDYLTVVIAQGCSVSHDEKATEMHMTYVYCNYDERENVNGAY